MTAARPSTWMPVYIGDYLADTPHLNRAQHGSYLLLIFAMWRTGGTLPDDDRRLAAIAKATPKQWQEDKALIAELFVIENGAWRHKRVDKELAAASAFIVQRGAAGKASAEARRRQREGNDRSTSVEREGVREGQREGKTSPSPSPSPSTVTTTPCVTTTARDRATHTGRVGLVPLDWEPSEADLTALRKGRPDLVGDWYTTRMQDFRDWCASAAVTSHDVAATWRGFMRKSRNAPKGMETDAEVEAAIERSKDFGKPGYKYGG